MTRDVRVTVLGSGSWGTTVAGLAASNAPTLLWARSPETAEEITTQHTNGRYLGDRRLSSKLRATSDLQEAAEHADVLVVGVPSHSMRAVLTQASPHLRPWIPVISLAKGLEPDSRKRPTQVLEEVLPGHSVGLLAGPNIAGEIAEGLAAAAVIATPDTAVATALQPLFARPRFRVYTNHDVLGCELGGILKNIVAIASGMGDGLGVGMNTRAMVISRGLAEMTRIGEAMGADPRTFAGLTGLGDLMATCMSSASRNRRVGEELASGKSIDEVLEGMTQVAEGVKTARSVVELAEEHDVAAPIAVEVDGVVNSGRTPAQAYRGLQKIAAGSEYEAA
ncbi:NAD(P)H-dependent glycerol-3-phosphate dehydrogenase [Actinomycetospora chibensis]|uniref:Glycerol-3-phosphate dehydrogenase [NAD(P)+] n=1 Tax=Actinomycetospora chibensis TaxID=663606 RepID=A0ABV9RUR3_9PSEU|nr:NAD(P)H-dependent glycerol-3-phosphate dehydrogenase [Actinomycetospora chibensis]MDD7925164.1 NAD(P)H-dependent glycerol-3-phosphate dehydrogenase [Actinomycetospora chibensis]